ncbi:pyridoxal phosphate-dependent transferase [Halenospora varia]|nr:pyridoxal phosphate-dependent transferase [Halenospora varia]
MADSSLMHKELTEHLQANFRVNHAAHLTYGQGPNGSPRLLKALASFFNRSLSSTQLVTEDELIVTSGVSQAIDALTWCIYDGGEVPIILYRCYPLETLQEIARFYQRHDLHLISDEIYANSTFRNSNFPFAEPKDFCANELRLGVLQTRNIDLLSSMSSINDNLWAGVLNDIPIVKSFINTNQQRLSRCYLMFSAFLDQHNIPYVKGGQVIRIPEHLIT